MGEVMGADHVGWATVRTLAFPLSEMKPWEGSEQRRDVIGLRCSQATSLFHPFSGLLSHLWNSRVWNFTHPIPSPS